MRSAGQHTIQTLILKNIVRGNVFRMYSSPDDDFSVEYNTEIGLLNRRPPTRDGARRLTVTIF